MTNLTNNGTNSYFTSQEDRPTGAIRSLQEIRDRDFGKDAFIWEVSQSGYIQKLLLLERFHTSRHDYGASVSEHFLPAMHIRDDGTERYTCFFLEQAGIYPHVDKPLPVSSNQFQTFFTLNDAVEYSNYLKTNEEYIATVKAYHARCDSYDSYY